MKKKTKINLSLVILFVFLFILNEKILFKIFPYTGLGVVGAVFFTSIFFFILFVGFGFVAVQESIWLSLVYFLFATGFIVVYSWRTHPSDVGQYPYLELKKCYTVAKSTKEIEKKDIFGSRYSRIAAIDKFEKDLPDFAFVLSKNENSVNFFVRKDSIIFLDDGWSFVRLRDSIFFISYFDSIILKRDFKFIDDSFVWKDENDNIVSLVNKKLVPETEMEKLFFKYLQWNR